MNLHTDSNALALRLQSRDATREPTWVRYILITVALIFFFKLLDVATHSGFCRSI